MNIRETKIVKYNPIPKKLRNREHFVFLHDNKTGPCNFRRRSERRLCDRLTSYCKSILEEHYALRLGKDRDSKSVKYVQKTLYPYAKRFAGQKTVSVPDNSWGTWNLADKDSCNLKDLTEAEYQTYVTSAAVADTGLKLEQVSVLNSDRDTHGLGKFSGVMDDRTNGEWFNMLARSWEVNRFEATFNVVEEFIKDGVAAEKSYEAYEVKITLQRVNKFFHDVWRFKAMSINYALLDTTDPVKIIKKEVNKDTPLVKAFLDRVTADKSSWGVAQDKKNTKKTDKSD